MQCPNCNHPLPENETPDVIDELEPEEKSPCPCKARNPKKKMYKPSWILIGVLAALLCALLIFVLANGSLHIKERTDLFSDGLLPVYVANGEEGGWGYVNKDGVLIIDAAFDSALPFSNGLAAVCTDGKWGYIDKKGEMVISPAFDDAGEFSRNGIAPVKKGEQWGYVAKNGKMVVNAQFDEAKSFGNESLALVCKNGLYGYINSRGTYAIEPRFQAANSFDSMGYAIVYAHGGWGMINKRGDFVITPQFDALDDFSSNGVARIVKDNKFGFINRDGLYVIEPTYAYAESFAENGLALVVNAEGKCGYVNKHGVYKIAPVYDNARSFVGGIAAVCTNAEANTWCYINKQGEALTDAIYTLADSAEAGLALTHNGTTYTYVNRRGEEVFSLDENVIGRRFHSDGYAIAVNYPTDGGDYTFSILNKKGEVICTVNAVSSDTLYHGANIYK